MNTNELREAERPLTERTRPVDSLVKPDIDGLTDYQNGYCAGLMKSAGIIDGKGCVAYRGGSLAVGAAFFATAKEIRAAEPPANFGWSQELPNDQCYWWWWDGDPDATPIPVSIMYSGTDSRYFASDNQHGWNRFQYVEDMGGWWAKITEPPLPV